RCRRLVRGSFPTRRSAELGERGAGAAAAAAPDHRGEAQLLDAERHFEARRIVAIVRMGGEAVNFAEWQTGIRRRRHDRLAGEARSEEHTSELQSRENLVCR